MSNFLQCPTRRYCSLAYTNPTKAILNVLGIQFIELEKISRRLMFLHRSVTSESESLCNKIVNEQCKLHGNTWISQHHHGLTSTTRNTLKNVIVAHVKEEHINLTCPTFINVQQGGTVPCSPH